MTLKVIIFSEEIYRNNLQYTWYILYDIDDINANKKSTKYYIGRLRTMRIMGKINK